LVEKGKTRFLSGFREILEISGKKPPFYPPKPPFYPPRGGENRGISGKKGGIFGEIVKILLLYRGDAAILRLGRKQGTF